MLCFFKSTLTVPKIKDLVNSPATKYEHIFDTITNSNTNANTRANTYVNEYSYTDIDLLPTNANTNESNSSTNAMKDELKHFLKKQLNNN